MFKMSTVNRLKNEGSIFYWILVVVQLSGGSSRGAVRLFESFGCVPKGAEGVNSVGGVLLLWDLLTNFSSCDKYNITILKSILRGILDLL